MFKRILISTLVMSMAACDRTANQPASQAAEVQGPVKQINDIGAYTLQANAVLNQARIALQNPKTDEVELVALIKEFEQLSKAAESINASKEQLMEPELMSTLGSLYSKRASFYPKDPTKAGVFAAKGVRYLDKAVEAYPNNITARLNRGIVSLRMPEFLNKTESARKDFELIRNSPAFPHLPETTRAMVESLLSEANGRLAKNGLASAH